MKNPSKHRNKIRVNPCNPRNPRFRQARKPNPRYSRHRDALDFKLTEHNNILTQIRLSFQSRNRDAFDFKRAT